MSVANYSACIFDHTRILISIRYKGNVSEETLNFILEKLKKYRKLIINDAGCAIYVCFEVNASPGNSSWGPFQAHRQVLGLLFIAEAQTPMEAALIQDTFNQIKEEYSPGLYHSRCLIFGIDTTIRHSHNQDIFQFSSHEAWKSAEYDIKELITSIFYDIESKRLKMSQEKNGKPPLIVAPFELSDSENAPLDSDSKTFRRKCIGRHHKHLADVSLLAGQLPESLLCYHSALDILISTNDTTWIGSALEGLCVVSALVFFPDLNPDQSLWLKEKTYKQFLDPRNLVNKQISAPSLTELRKLCIPTVEDLVDRYKEAIIHYSRCKSLGIIEMEACIKATKVLTKAKKYLEASEFLQNAVYITLNLPDSERIKRYSVLADLYEGIGFLRKASFYKRVAAMQCVAPQLKEPDWKLCNNLLLKSLSGYSLDLNEEFLDSRPLAMDCGWPSVRLRVLHELVYSSEKVGNHSYANRCMLYLLVKMFPHLTETDEKEVCTALESFAKKQTASAEMRTEIFLPQLALYALPALKSIVPQSLTDEARPVKASPGIHKSDSVFIYTPASYQSQMTDHSKVKFTWCVNAACTVSICMQNPLTYSTLHVSHFSLITDAKNEKLHCQPLSFMIPPKSEKEVILIVTPSSPGIVSIVGYYICILGSKSKCYFRHINELAIDQIDIEVIQELPLLKCSHAIQHTTSPEDSTPMITVFCGEKYTVPFMLMNIGQCPVQDVRFSIKGNIEDLSLTFEDHAKLPLEPNTTLILPVTIEPNMTHPGGKVEPCTICIRYAGSVMKNTWWRSITIDLSVKVEVCIMLNDITVESGDENSATRCVAVFDVENNLTELVKVQHNHISPDETRTTSLLSIGPSCFKTLHVDLKRICLSEVSQKPLCVEDFCSSHLRDFLSLKWKIESEHINDRRMGDIYLQNTLSRSSVCNLLKSPISCQVQVNDVRGSESRLLKTDVGTPCQICFEFQNTTSSQWTFDVRLEVFQDQLNGFIEWNMDESVLCLGTTAEKLEIDSQGTTLFQCEVLILRTGEYSVRTSYTVTFPNDLEFKYSTPSKSILYYSPVVNVDAC